MPITGFNKGAFIRVKVHKSIDAHDHEKLSTSCLLLLSMVTLKKSLGQHFLIDETVTKKIIHSLNDFPFTQLLEIGPGGGALTKYLVGLQGVDLKCVEVDDEKVQWLKKKFPQLENRIIHTDFLEMKKPFDGPFTIIGNFPYNISTQILFKVLEWKDDIQSVTGMFQKEVAARTAASEGNKVYGVLSVLIQAFFRVEYLFDVDEQAFNPPPKVKSAVIRLLPRNEPMSMKSQRSFFVLVKTAFNQRRKTLRNAVKSLFDQEVLQDPLFNQRAEQLSVEAFGELTFRMKQHSP
jgi:16S rRNA (adenine1518-N6/adenine1519-N6)-dimethyltransferase